ncbi:MAG TPA: OsmC family protein [Terriglobia bacterium]|nr:OsmC family protein [Terriglobia bacterium]
MEPKKTYKAYQFKNAIEWKSARKGIMTVPEHAPVEVGSPPEFKGSADVWCPEEMLVGAVNTCIMLTFLAYAQNRKLELVSYRSRAEGALEHKDGKYRITHIALQPVIGLKSQEHRPLAEQILKNAKEDCFISNSVTATVEVTAQFGAESTET